MRIAIVAGLFPKISETFILNQITGLIDLGHDVSVFAFGRTKESEGFHKSVAAYKLLEKTCYFNVPKSRRKRIMKAAGIILKMLLKQPESFRIFRDYRKYGSYQFLNNLFKLEYFIDKKFDVVHCHFGPIANEIIFLKDVFPSVKCFVTFHGYDIRLGLAEGGDMYTALFSNVDGVFSICDYNKKQLIQFGCLEKKILDLPNGVDPDIFKRKERDKNEKFKIISVGRMVKEKNYSFALKVMKSLKEEGKIQFEYHIVGDGYLRQELEDEIKKYGLEPEVVLHGAQNQEFVIERMNEADMFLLPSQEEAFSVALLEAQLMELPVIATNVGGVCKALIDGKTGYLVAVNDIQQAVKRIYDLNNTSLSRELGQQGRAYVVNGFNIGRINKQMEEYYETK